MPRAPVHLIVCTQHLSLRHSFHCQFVVGTFVLLLQRALQNDDSKYAAKIKALMENLSTRLIINVSDMREWDRAATEELLLRPTRLLPVMEAAVKECVLGKASDYFEKVDAARGVERVPGAPKYDRICVGFEGNFGNLHVTPRTLSSGA